MEEIKRRILNLLFDIALEDQRTPNSVIHTNRGEYSSKIKDVFKLLDKAEDHMKTIMISGKFINDFKSLRAQLTARKEDVEFKLYKQGRPQIHIKLAIELLTILRFELKDQTRKNEFKKLIRPKGEMDSLFDKYRNKILLCGQGESLIDYRYFNLPSFGSDGDGKWYSNACQTLLKAVLKHSQTFPHNVELLEKNSKNETIVANAVRYNFGFKTLEEGSFDETTIKSLAENNKREFKRLMLMNYDKLHYYDYIKEAESSFLKVDNSSCSECFCQWEDEWLKSLNGQK